MAENMYSVFVMKTKELVAEDLWPLIGKLSPTERLRLAQLATAEAGPVPDAEDRYPLRGKPVIYRDPTLPIAEKDWDALR